MIYLICDVMKKYINLLFYFISFLFMEIIFKLIVFDKFFSMSLINTFVYILFASCFCFTITTFMNRRFNRINTRIVLATIAVLYSMQICVYNMFSFFFSLSLLNAAGQTLEFASDIVRVIFSNIFYIILMFVPFIMSFVLKKFLCFDRHKGKQHLFNWIITLIILAIFFGTLFINKNKDYSPYKAYFKHNDIALEVQNLGLLDATANDFFKFVFKFSEQIDLDITIPDNNTGKKEEPKPEEKVYKYNNLDIDFTSLIENEKNSTLKNMHTYFANDKGTLQNDYTGFFKGKNLILFMAESYNEIAVNEELTPTFYKLTHEGFVFDNYYSPTISSTLGGEFQELSGLYPANGFVNHWKSGKNSYPMGLGKVFADAGYNTFAYHDHWYRFQDRHIYLKSLGFTNFKGCGNGLGDIMNCNQWPEDDVQMINVTVDDYINSDKPFMVFYAAVSGHGNYSWGGNAMSKKNKELVKDLPYSDGIKAYIAAQIQFDRALETLIKKLEEAGKLEDTVIAFAPDHYPYMLNMDEINGASTYKRDSIVEVNHTNFVLWNSAMEKVEVKKVGSTIDVMPTIYNVMGIPYDSRLFIGKDILSTEPGLAIFGNRSWVSDYGTYFASSKKFVPKDGVDVPEDYVSNMNKAVSNKIAMSGYILSQNYYKKVLGD